MADFNRRGLGCDDDCGGENGEHGERGKRGKRGPRGHRGHDGHNGHDGRDGASVFDAVLPPFPLDAPVFHTIFANQNGSDENGDGSGQRPFRTFVEAARHVPIIIPPGNVFTIDITDLGDELLPVNYEMPPWKCAHVVTLDFADPFFLVQSGVNIRADLRPASALTPSQQVITAGSQNQDPVTNILSIQDPTKVGPDAWVPGALVGLQVVGAGAAFERGVVYANTSDTIFITFSLEMTFPVQLMEQSARFLTTATVIGFAGGITVGHCESLGIQGVAIEPTDLSMISLLEYASSLHFQGCSVINSDHNNPDRQAVFEACNVIGSSFASEIYLASTRLAEMFFVPLRPAQVQFSFFDGTVLDACSTVEVTDSARATAPIGGLLFIRDALIINSTDDAIRWWGGNATILSAEIRNANGDALHFIGPGFHQLSNVSGTGNAGVGVRVENGAQVQIDSGVAVTGTDDQQVGSLPAGPYPAGPFNLPDFTGPDATGSRLFNPAP